MAASCGLRFLRSQAGKATFVSLADGLNSDIETGSDGAPMLLVEAEAEAGEVLVTWLGLDGARLQRKGSPTAEDLNPGNNPGASRVSHGRPLVLGAYISVCCRREHRGRAIRSNHPRWN